MTTLNLKPQGSVRGGWGLGGGGIPQTLSDLKMKVKK